MFFRQPERHGTTQTGEGGGGGGFDVGVGSGLYNVDKCICFSQD